MSWHPPPGCHPNGLQETRSIAPNPIGPTHRPTAVVHQDEGFPMQQQVASQAVGSFAAPAPHPNLLEMTDSERGGPILPLALLTIAATGASLLWIVARLLLR